MSNVTHMRRIVHVYTVEVDVLENEQDGEFVFNDMGNGKKVMAPF